MRIANTIAPNSLFMNSPQTAGRGRNARIAQIKQSRLEDQKRELKIRQREDERIKELHEKIQVIKTSDDLSIDQRFRAIESIAFRIEQIHESRLKREQLANERELVRQQMLIDETTQMKDRPEQDKVYKDQEEAEEAQEREGIRSLTRLAAQKDTMSTLRSTRAQYNIEAGMLGRAIENDNRGSAKIGRVPGASTIHDIIFSVRSGFNSYDFRNNHLGQLREAIAGLDAAIQTGIANMYRESLQYQESQLVQHKEDKEDKDKENEEGFGEVDVSL